jgi:hypothetical protein
MHFGATDCTERLPVHYRKDFNSWKGSIMQYGKYFLFVFFAFSLLSACSEDDPVTPQQGHFDAIGVVLTTSGIEVVSILRGVTNDTLKVQAGQLTDHFDVSFYDENEHVVDAPDDPAKTMSWEIGDLTIVEVHQDDGQEGKFEVHLRGLQAGTTTLELFIMHEGHSDFRSGKIPVVVE